MNILIKHKDKSSIRLSAKKLHMGDYKIKTSFYNSDGYYSATSSFDDVVTRDDLERQLNQANDSGSIVKQFTQGGKEIDFQRMVIA